MMEMEEREMHPGFALFANARTRGNECVDDNVKQKSVRPVQKRLDVRHRGK
jgi:hypothetical protein